MGLFWFGALCGGMTMFFTAILIGALTVEEKDKEIAYLKKRLSEQARTESDEY